MPCKFCFRWKGGPVRSFALRLLIVLTLLPGFLTPAPAIAEDAVPDISCASGGSWVSPVRICVGSANFFTDVCRGIEALSAYYTLPEGYLARLIWQESRFNPSAISPAGAQGIAQFMPGTARIRGVRDSFQPAEGLLRAAEYLDDLRTKFGNLGLAAAAYNGGEGRISRWQIAGGWLPIETRDYVQIITGHAVEDWTSGTLGDVDFSLGGTGTFEEKCLDLAKGAQPPRVIASGPRGDWRPWGVLIAQNYSSSIAEAAFTRVTRQYASVLGSEKLLLLTVHNPSFGPRARHSAMIGRDSKKAADQLCAKLQAAGGVCVVVKN